jgi:predicted transcriptional regulator YdeE
MEHAFVELPDMRLAGLDVNCPGFDTSGIPPLWERFVPRLEQLRPHGVWGASLPAADGFRYLAGMQLADDSAMPADFVVETIPGGRYLRTPFFDTPDKMSAEFQRVFHELLPSLGLSIKPGFCCLEEYLHDESDAQTGKLRCNLYVQLL